MQEHLRAVSKTLTSLRSQKGEEVVDNFDIGEKPFSLKRETAAPFVPQNRPRQQLDLFGEAKLTRSPADELVPKLVPPLAGQKSLLESAEEPCSTPDVSNVQRAKADTTVEQNLDLRR